MSFYKRLKEERKKHGMTSREMAHAIGVAPSSYSQYENGKREPDVFKIKLITEILEVSADYLLFGKTPTDNSHQILQKYNCLNELGKQKADEYITDLSEQPKYTAMDSGNIAEDIAKEIQRATALDTKHTSKR